MVDRVDLLRIRELKRNRELDFDTRFTYVGFVTPAAKILNANKRHFAVPLLVSNYVELAMHRKEQHTTGTVFPHFWKH